MTQLRLKLNGPYLEPDDIRAAGRRLGFTGFQLRWLEANIDYLLRLENSDD